MPDAVNLARLLREFKKAAVACLLSFFSVTLSLVCTRLFAGRVQVMYEKFMIYRMKNRPMSNYLIIAILWNYLQILKFI